MEQHTIPEDDILDVISIANELESYISKLVEENEVSLVMSALGSIFAKFVIEHCTCLDQILIYRKLFIEFLDHEIRSFNFKQKE